MKLYIVKNPAVDEWVPVGQDYNEKIVSIGYRWVGTNVIGMWLGSRCLFGVEFRFNSEPSAGIICNNYAIGVWKPQN